MDKIIITTDSGMDPIDTRYMVSGILNRNDGKTFKDVSEITSREVLEQMKEGYSFKTSAPFGEDYMDIYNLALSEADKIIHLSMGESISSTSLLVSNIVASDIGIDRIKVLDSKTGATGGTLLNYYANYLIENGLSYSEIIREIDEYMSNISTSFLVPDPQGFIRSGRDSSSLCLKEKALILGTAALKIAGMKYRVDFNEEGRLYTKQILRGKSSSLAMNMIEQIVNDKTIKYYDTKMAVIGTVLEQNVDMAQLQTYLENYFDCVYRQDINAVVAAYGSSDLVGISLKRKK